MGLANSIQQTVSSNIITPTELKIVVVGEAGQGKSTLINRLLGKEVANEGDQFDAGTAEIKYYNLDQNGISVKIWDMPGFGFSSEEEDEKMVEQLRRSDCFPHDLALFCFKMDDTRFPKRIHTDTVKIFTQIFGKKFWKHTVFILTFANAVLRLCPEDEEVEYFFSNRVETLQNKIHAMLRKTVDGLSDDEVKKIRAIPVGSYKKGGYDPDNPWRLPDREDWFVWFWIECTEHMRQASLRALLQANRHQINIPVVSEVAPAFGEDPPLHKEAYERSIHPPNGMSLEKIDDGVQDGGGGGGGGGGFEEKYKDTDSEESLSAPLQPERGTEVTMIEPLRPEGKTKTAMIELFEKLQLKEQQCAIYKLDFEAERNDRLRLHQQCEELNQELRKAKERIIELEQEKADKIKEIKKEMQTLTTQVNAYNREIDRQKGLVTQSQEKHKAEVARMRQQLDQEHAKQEKEIEGMRKANKVLMERDSALKQSQLALEEELHQAKEENTSLRIEISKLQSSWKVNHKDVTLSKEELGRGGWGVVWVGQFRGHSVAVKELHEAIRSSLYLENLHREINTMSQLRHPNLLQFIGAVLDHPSGNPMIITEVMDTSLRKAYERKELTPDPGCRPVILYIMRDVAVGLNYLHCLPDPIIHRDVSSANVLLESKGDKKWKTKISDFGSAKAANKAVTRLPGAEPYTAPEALAQHIMSTDPNKEQTTKMDVFSYGVLLCEIITCHFPDRYVFRDMLHQVQSISSRPIGTSDTQGSLLYSLIVWCCKDNPLERPSMSQIIEQIDVISM
ncbi:PREDICTED: uncharacterized protein LOC109581597 [Amphimedon queenslandica]|uniref:Protein kinase domain-containing protein n=1 Tax=Amphimedon queenslandica TaxID=400682 RepID=A0AAN0J3U8_AMPQE|nr:PREDICTED: uncharacterized protein LOC109581597 [Amphimedon queenslandica]|eukprot:XP_019851412.1 PREDICTED: uncharacterized protein LOC109581597 [Amphimedon queenslandica]